MPLWTLQQPLERKHPFRVSAERKPWGERPLFVAAERSAGC